MKYRSHAALLLIIFAPLNARALDAQLAVAPAEDTTVCFAFPAGATQATTRIVAPGESIQAVIDVANDGDVLSLAAGIYVEDINFNGKAIRVVGRGPATIIQGTGTRSVVTFANGESFDSVLDSVTIRGGRAPMGGGVFISGSSPTIIRSIITENRASSSGSGIHVAGGSQARIYNNLLSYNTTAGGDPHSLQIIGSSPVVVNNTIARGDSNGILISGTATPVIMNNVIALNGTTEGGVRGRGICDFSSGRALITFNDFFRNRIAALLRGGRDWGRVESLQAQEPSGPVADNVDGRPGNRWNPPRDPAPGTSGFFGVAGPQGQALDSGNPDPSCNDLDGSRNTMGLEGGPFASGSTHLPVAGACGL